MSDAMQRHWQMLHLVPRAPRKVDAGTLEAKLRDRGFTVTRRSIQRDLNKLSGHFALTCDDRHKPYGWSWSQDAVPFDIPGMDVHTALAFNLAAEHLAHLLPHGTFDHLRHHFTCAAGVLDDLKTNHLAHWRDCVRVLPSGLPMAPPTIDADVLAALHDGLLYGRQLRINYQKREKTTSKSYIANPLALVYRDTVAYLVCALFNYDNVVQLAVHRMGEIEETGEPVRVPSDFDVDRYIDAGEFGYRVGDAPLALRLRLRRTVAFGLGETPIAPDQRIEPCEPREMPGDTAQSAQLAADDDWVILRATVANTARLRVWLRGCGELCEVLDPPELRAEIGAELRAAAARYG